MLTAIQQGDQQAFTTIYYKYYEALCRKAFRRVPNEAVVEEIVQDVFVALWKKANTLDASGNVSAWLYATLRFQILHQLRSETNRKHYEDLAKQLITDETLSSSEVQLDAKELNEKVMDVIATLPEQCKTAFVLSRFENLNYNEIAARMGISVRTVEKHISKALQVLRETLKEHELGLAVILLVVNLVG